MTTADYLTQLQQDKEDLVDNLEAKGITGLTGDETFTELVPEVLNISSGGGNISEYINYQGSPRQSQAQKGGWTDFIKKMPAVELSISNGSYLYAGCKATEIDLSGLTIISNGFQANYMFSDCSEVETLNFTNVDLSKIQNTSRMFYNCGSLKNLIIGNKTFSSRITNANYMFYGCSKLKAIPYFDSSGVYDFSNAFRMCTDLEDVPLLPTDNLELMQYAFANCNNLTDTSIDNILQMCANATHYTGTKTLASLSFTSTMATSARIEALPHYQDFIDAGWTIGY